MSSTYKTTNLGLNQFVGSDRPKMEDFNFDNQQIDQKFQEHVLSNLHLTEQQREQLGKASYQIGSYSGDGQASRTIAVEGEIGFGLIFMVGEVFNQTVTSSGTAGRGLCAACPAHRSNRRISGGAQHRHHHRHHAAGLQQGRQHRRGRLYRPAERHQPDGRQAQHAQPER